MPMTVQEAMRKGKLRCAYCGAGADVAVAGCVLYMCPECQKVEI